MGIVGVMMSAEAAKRLAVDNTEKSRVEDLEAKLSVVLCFFAQLLSFAMWCGGAVGVLMNACRKLGFLVVQVPNALVEILSTLKTLLFYCICAL